MHVDTLTPGLKFMKLECKLNWQLRNAQLMIREHMHYVAKHKPSYCDKQS